MPADATFARFVGVVRRRRRRRRRLNGGKCIRGLARHVPRQRGNENERHRGGGRNEHKAAAEAASAQEAVGLNREDQRHIEQR